MFRICRFKIKAFLSYLIHHDFFKKTLWLGWLLWDLCHKWPRICYTYANTSRFFPHEKDTIRSHIDGLIVYGVASFTYIYFYWMKIDTTVLCDWYGCFWSSFIHLHWENQRRCTVLHFYVEKCFPRRKIQWSMVFLQSEWTYASFILILLSYCNGSTLRWNGPSWPWSYGSWIYNYLCNQCLSPLMLWVRISIRARCTTLCDKYPVSSTNKTDRHDVTEILLKVALNTIKQTNKDELFLLLHKLKRA